MPPTIHIMRHAESEHNVIRPDGDNIRDPDLTVPGRAYAQGVVFPHMANVRVVISSPLRRAVDTALIVFGDLLQEQNAKLVVIPELKEAGFRPSNTGSPAQELREEFGYAIQLGFLRDGWWYREASHGVRVAEEVAERARQARVYVRQVANGLNDDDHIVLVTHRGTVRHLVENAPRLKNVEFRSYRFANPAGDDEDAVLTEIIEIED
ncbi:hypothetical protein GQX73_g10772 [Xylaria multiplex]|uniref:Phosphoglycerate mutase n=1 Tax=Xylaria multiplex TaxID=323545 RepID=A0A7C8IGG7_9PEZI|nr:hypothetical protein GQX73_g10772 [Xylaria multiplex]